MEDVTEGWSLAKRLEASSADVVSMGLLPRKCYALTVSLEMSPAVLENPTSPQPSVFSEAADILHPDDASPNSEQFKLPLPPLKVHPTGFGLPDLRTSLLGGRMLNRFSSFVATGTEDWVLNGTREEVSPPQQGTSRVSSEDSERSDDDDGSTIGSRLYTKALSETEHYFVEVGSVCASFQLTKLILEKAM